MAKKNKSEKAEVIVKQNPDKPVPVEVLAESIKAISRGIEKLLAGPLKDETLYLLIAKAAPNVGGKYGNGPMSTRQVRAVIQGIKSLEREYLK
jgi:hypothetical protein